MGFDPVSVAVGSSVLGAGASIFGGIAGSNAAQKAGEAEYIAAKLEARRIRREGREARSAARAAYAGAGVVVDEGTSAVVEAEIAKRAKEDAMNMILTGKRRMATANAQGDASLIGGFLGAAGTALDTASTIKGWKK